MGTRTIQDLRMRQALPLEIKIRMTESRIRDWVNVYGTDGVYVSFSGGKDSTVLLHIVRNIYPNVKAMFVDIPTQYPELKQFVQTFDNVDITKPKINFFQVCEKYGFPMISKEVSEAVYDARRYLSQVENKLTIATDRQTDNLFMSHGGYIRDSSTGEGQGKRGFSESEKGDYP